MAEDKERQNKRDLQAKIANLWFKGYNRNEILKATGCEEKELNQAMKLIKAHLSPKAVKVLKYRKARCLGKVTLVQRTAWEILSNSFDHRIQIAALRVITTSQELEAKIEGAIQEKLIVGPEKAADSLIKAIYELEKETKGEAKPDGNGHDEDKEVFPHFLGKGENAE